MKRTWLWIMGLCMFGAAAQAVETGKVLGGAELKAEPFIDAKTLQALPADSDVEVFKRQGGWMQVKPADGTLGWVKLVNLKLGGESTAKGSSGLGEVWNVARSGRSGNTGVTVTTGVRGLGEEEMKNAKPDPAAVKQLKEYAAPATEAEAFAAKGGLKRQQLNYLAAEQGGKQP